MPTRSSQLPKSRAGRRTEVLFAGIFAWGNKSAYEGALNYLATAYPHFGSNSNVTGVAIHPYEHDTHSFYKPPGQPQYNQIEAFKYAVAGFHAQLVGLAGGGPQKSLWITEAGWPAEGPEYAVGLGEQANLLTSYGQSGTGFSIGAEEGPNAVKETIYHLAPNTIYHYRVVATNGLGTTYGGDRTFTTETAAAFAGTAAGNTVPNWNVGSSTG